VTTGPDAEPARGSPIGRRRFLLAGGAGAVAVTALGAFGPQVASAGTTSTAAAKRPSPTHDLEVAALAAGLEVLAVGTYKSALDATAAGTLGSVPAAGAAYLKTAMSHHQTHLDRWNARLQAAGRPIVTSPNSRLKPTIDHALAQAKDFARVAELARDLEETAAATYLRAISTLQSPDAVNLAGSIHIIDMSHVAILNYVLGEYPVPDTFANTGKAASA
jgi:hypothetical protein